MQSLMVLNDMWHMRYCGFVGLLTWFGNNYVTYNCSPYKCSLVCQIDRMGKRLFDISIRSQVYCSIPLEGDYLNVSCKGWGMVSPCNLAKCYDLLPFWKFDTSYDIDVVTIDNNPSLLLLVTWTYMSNNLFILPTLTFLTFTCITIPQWIS